MKPWSTVSDAPWRRRATSCAWAPESAEKTQLPSGVTTTPAGDPGTMVVVTWAAEVRSGPVATVRAGQADSENERVDDAEASAQVDPSTGASGWSLPASWDASAEISASWNDPSPDDAS